MSEQDQTESNGGVGISGVVGGAAGGAATYLAADAHLAKKGIRTALGFDAKPETPAPAAPVAEATAPVAETPAPAAEAAAPTTEAAAPAAKETAAKADKVAETYQTKTDAILTDEANKSLRSQKAVVESLKNPKHVEAIDSVTFAAAKEGKGFEATFAAGKTQSKPLSIKKLPEGVTAGTPITDKTAIKGLFEGEKAPMKAILQTAENDVVAGVRKVGGRTMGFRSAGVGGKLGIAAATVAGVAAGGTALHAIFGGKNTNKVEAERATSPDQATARG